MEIQTAIDEVKELIRQDKLSRAIMDLRKEKDISILYDSIVQKTKKAKDLGKNTFMENTFFVTYDQIKELERYLNIPRAHPLQTPYGWADLYGEFR